MSPNADEGDRDGGVAGQPGDAGRHAVSQSARGAAAGLGWTKRF